MSTCVTKMPHSCGSSDALQVYVKEDGSYDGFCFSCNTYVPDPLGGEKLPEENKRSVKTEEEIKEELKFIGSLGCTDLIDRKLRKSALEHFGIKIGLSEEDGKTPTFEHFPYTKDGKVVKYKTKYLPNGRVWSTQLTNDVDLFGWEQAVKSGSKKLIITEGENDAVAVLRILEIYGKKEFEEYRPSVVSVPNGAPSASRDIQKRLNKIKKTFKEIYLCFDQDSIGIKAMEDVCKIAPEFKVITLPDKDANDCLKNGKGKAAFKAIMFNGEKAKNTRIIWGYDIHEKAKVPPEWGLSWPWDKMTKYTRGLRPGETIYLGAGEKMGKSEVVNALAKHLIVEHGLKVLLAKPEESNIKTYKMLNSKVTGKIFHDPKVKFDSKAYEEGGKLIKDKVCMLNLYQNITWDVLKSDMYTAASMGVKSVFIDPITNLTNGMSSGEINEHLQGVSQELSTIAMDLNLIIFIFCHLNKVPKGATPWDRGGKINTEFFAGSSAMARSCNYALGLEGNRDPELEESERNMRKLVLLADREFGESGEVSLYWDRKTGLFNEV